MNSARAPTGPETRREPTWTPPSHSWIAETGPTASATARTVEPSAAWPAVTPTVSDTANGLGASAGGASGDAVVECPSRGRPIHAIVPATNTTRLISTTPT